MLTLCSECIHNTIPKKKRWRKESLILRLPQHQKCHVLYSFGSFQRSLEHPQTLFFGNVWKSSEVPVMTGQKYHAFDSEKVGSYELELAKWYHNVVLTRTQNNSFFGEVFHCLCRFCKTFLWKERGVSKNHIKWAFCDRIW